MSYAKEIHDKVSSDFSERRKSAREILRVKKEDLNRQNPRFREIEAELSQTGLNIARAVLQNKEDTVALLAHLQERNLALQEERRQLLVKMGLPADYLQIKYHCEKCSDEGYINGKPCECYRQALKNETYAAINSTSELNLCDFSNFNLNYYPVKDASGTPSREKMKQIYEVCLKYAQNFSLSSRNILMMGNTGLGKTFLSLAIARAVINRGYGVVYVSAQNVLNTIEQEKFSKNSNNDTLDVLLDCDLLILDDLGAEFVTPFTVSTVYNLINTRMNSRKPTIISTNMTFSQLREIYSDRMVSRWVGEYMILRFFGNDIRQIKLSERADQLDF